MQGIYEWSVARPGKSPLVYVGQARDIAKRFRDYNYGWNRDEDKDGNNVVLRRAVLKYGLKAVTFAVLEFVEDENQLTDREQYWYACRVAELGRENVANFIEPRENPMCNLEVNTKHWTPARRAQQADIARRTIAKAHCAPIAKAHARAKTYSGFMSPDGVIYSDIINLSAFCREHQLRVQAMHSVARGKIYRHRGWMAVDVFTPPPARNGKVKTYPGFVAPDGRVYRDVTNLSAFCRAHNLLKGGLSKVASGKANSHRGWTLHHNTT